MAHLTHFGLENFRVFKDKTDFEFRPITILTGTNSSGKSSLTKGIMLMQQCFNEPDLLFIRGKGMMNLHFNGDNHILGDFDEVKNNQSNNDNIIFSFPFRWWSIPDKMTLKLSYKKNISDNNNDGELRKLVVILDETGEELLELERKINTDDSIIEYSDIKKININLLIKLVDSSLSKYFKARKVLDELIDSGLVNCEKPHTDERYYGDTIELYETIIQDFWKFFDESFLEKELKKLTGSDKDKLNDLINKFKAYRKYLSITDSAWKAYSFNTELPYYNAILGISKKKNFVRNIEESKGLEFGRHSRGFQNDFSNDFVEIEDEKLKFIQSGLPILDYKSIDKLDDKQIQAIKNVEIQWFEKFLNFEFPKNSSSAFIFDLRRPSMRTYIQDWLKSTEKGIAPEEKKISELLKEQYGYEIEEKDISIGEKYFYFYKLVTEGLEKSFAPLFRTLGKNIHSIPSIRAIPTRFMSRRDSSTFFEELIQQVNQINPGKESTVFLQKWIQAFGIADDIKIKTISNLGIKEIFLVKNGKETNIADVGYGFSQLLPIVLNVAFFNPTAYPNKGYIQIIEEPETNLHPALQSKLADFFVECYEKFNIQFIIETHSEYLIRKLQYLIAKKKFKHDDANIYYFYPPNKVPDGEPQVKRIDFEEDGILSDSFGAGFFDEADNLAMSLFALDKSQKN